MRRLAHGDRGPVALSPADWEASGWLEAAEVFETFGVVLVTRRGRRRAWWAADGGFGSREGRDQRDQ